MEGGDRPLMILIRSKTNTIKIKTKALRSEENCNESKENLKYNCDETRPAHQFDANSIDQINAEPEHMEFGEEWLTEMNGGIKKLDMPLSKKYKEHPDARYACRFCKKNFRFLGRLEKHMVEHYARTVYHCDRCDQDFKAFQLLKDHINQHMVDQPIVCFGCPSTFKTPTDLDEHVRSGTCGASGMIVQCVLCSDTFLSPRSLSVHISKQHTRMSYMCKHCGRTCDGEYELSIHVMSHKHEKSPWRKREKCVVCKRTFASKNGLHEHQQNQHFEIMAHQCRYCERNFSTKSNLKRHIKYSCGGKKPQAVGHPNTNVLEPALPSNEFKMSDTSIVVEPDLRCFYDEDQP